MYQIQLHPETIASWPVHDDPNFDAATYGEGGKAANVNALQWLKDQQEAGEEVIVGFYTGLRPANGRDTPKHRYLIGYFAVNDIHVIRKEQTDYETKKEILENNPENAHTKRFKHVEGNEGRGELFVFNERDADAVGSGATTLNRFALVDGQAPGIVFSNPIQMSTYSLKELRKPGFQRTDSNGDPQPSYWPSEHFRELYGTIDSDWPRIDKTEPTAIRPTYWLSDTFADIFGVVDDQRSQWLGLKPPIRLDISAEEFRTAVASHA